jgi:hypothetical protein
MLESALQAFGSCSSTIMAAASWMPAGSFTQLRFQCRAAVPRLKGALAEPSHSQPGIKVQAQPGALAQLQPQSESKLQPRLQQQTQVEAKPAPLLQHSSIPQAASNRLGVSGCLHALILLLHALLCVVRSCFWKARAQKGCPETHGLGPVCPAHCHLSQDALQY